jgi:hypothetical protein
MPLPVQTQLDSLTARLNLIDGLGLVYPAVGAIANLGNRINGMQSDLQAATLLMESVVDGYNNSVLALQAQFNAWPTAPTEASISTVNSRIDGVQSDLQAAILLMESIINSYQSQVAAYIALWQGKYNTSGGISSFTLLDTETGLPVVLSVSNGTLEID